MLIVGMILAVRSRCEGAKVLNRHIWQDYLDLVEQLRKTQRGKEIYAMRKETIERVFGDAKEKHANALYTA